MDFTKVRSQFWLTALLLLYVAARALQLVPDRLPSLLIVVLHVIPPALFAVLHGARVYRLRGMLIFSALCLGIASLFEMMSLRTGFPFGHYEFTTLMGPKVFGLPILLALAYLGMGYVSWVLAILILDSEDKPLCGSNLLLAPLIASLAMLAWDFSMDIVWADIDRAWIWRDGGMYFGVPLSNFAGWFLTTYVFNQCFAFYVRDRASVPQSSARWRLAVAFYAASAAGNFLVVAPLSHAADFVDQSGKHWMFSGILWASKAASIVLMMPLAFAAWIKAGKSARADDLENM